MRRTGLLQQGGVLSFLLVALLAWGLNPASSAAKFSREGSGEPLRQQPGSGLRQKIERVENGLLPPAVVRSEEHTSELQSQSNLVCRLLLEKKKRNKSDSCRI